MTQTTASPQRANWRWLIPVFMLILAALACDEPYIDPPHVVWVDADATTPGHVFAYVTSDTSDVDAVYETDDYGQHWRLSRHTPAEAKADSPQFSMSGETLYMNGRAVWSFPRPIFRFFFFDDSSASGQQFRLPYGSVSASIQGDRLYAAMGTEGVLVGRLTSAGTLEDWQLTADGIDTIHPLPLTITDPAEMLGVTAFGLFVPPYALIHAFLLYCLWIYLLPRDKARRYAIFTSLGLMAVAAVATVIWLADIRTDYFPVVGVVTAITALTGVSLTLVFANGQTNTPKKGWLALASLLASLIAPAGVAAIFVGWWAVYLVVFGYTFFRRTYFRYFQPEEGNWRERWLVDRLALETVTMGGIILGMVVIGITAFRALMASFSGDIELLGLVAFLMVSMILLPMYLNFRLKHLDKIKRNEVVRPAINVAIIVWLVSSGMASAATFIGQAVAYGWFTDLLK